MPRFGRGDYIPEGYDIPVDAPGGWRQMVKKPSKVVAAPAPVQKQHPKFLIYITLVTDAGIPGKGNILHISASYSKDLEASWNITPQRPVNFDVLPAEKYEPLKANALPLEDAMRGFVDWLGRFKGKRHLVCRGMDFWWLMTYMREHEERLPFVPTPIDVESVWRGAQGNLLRQFPRKSLTTPKETLAYNRQMLESVLGRM